MTFPSMLQTVPVTLHLTARDADLLGDNSAREFLLEQPGRFMAMETGDPSDARWRGGSMTWCATASEALLLRAYERSTGVEAMLLSDEGVIGFDPPYVVLSTRRFAA